MKKLLIFSILALICSGSLSAQRGGHGGGGGTGIFLASEGARVGGQAAGGGGVGAGG